MASPSVVVFGATGAIGSSLAKALHGGGRRAFLVGRNVEKVSTRLMLLDLSLTHVCDICVTFLIATCHLQLQPLAESLSFQHAQCDVMKPGGIQRAMEEAMAAGPISGVAYCVGDITLKPLKRTTSDDFLNSYRLNVLGAAEAIKVGPHIDPNSSTNLVPARSLSRQPRSRSRSKETKPLPPWSFFPQSLQATDSPTTASLVHPRLLSKESL